MISIARSALAITLLSLSLNTSAALSEMPSGDYTLDKSHGYISFTYSHLGFSTPHVGFRSFDVNLTLDSANPENSSVVVVIDAGSVDSRVDEFNKHLNGPNFFDTENFPEITFTATAIKSSGENTFDITGDLTIKGVTKSVVLATTIVKAANHPMRNVPTIGVSATTRLNRSEFEMGRLVPNVGDEVSIDISVELPQKK